ncbi:MAG: GSCFA domain-containing protein [Rhodobacteraceae bacterium]|nr:GSCFA domain-containing protein [Paracoccaceae bacterium]
MSFEMGKTRNRRHTQGLTHFEVKPADGQHRKWFRGEHRKFAPDLARLTPADAVRRWVLDGWVPEEPMIDRNTRVTAFGSCFADHISSWLGGRNYRVSREDEAAQDTYVVRIGEGMVNTFVIRQQFEWAWENKVYDEPLWHGYKAEDFGYDPEVQRATKELFDTTDVFILTLGLSEVWYDEVTGGVFWRTIPRDVYDPERHKFRVSTVEENRDNIEAIYALIRKRRPEAKVIFTLSPVPLAASFRDVSCISANSVSKAVLRVAVDEFMRANRDAGHAWYWPSYEIIMDVFDAPFDNDRRHLNRTVLDFVMMQFEEVWCVNEGDRANLAEQWVKAQAATQKLPLKLMPAVQNRNTRALERTARILEDDADVKLGAARKKLLEEILEEWQREDEATKSAAE